MTTGAISDSEPKPEAPASKSSKPRSRRSGVQQLVLLVVSAGALFWGGRLVWDARHPISVAARRLHSPDTAERLAAIQELSHVESGSTGDAIRALTPALADLDPSVRRTAAQALVGPGAVAAKNVTDSEAVHEAVRGLVGALKDPDPSVQIGAAGSLRILAGVTPGNAGRRGGRGGGSAPAKTAESIPSVVDKAAVVTALLDLLADQNPDVRQAAIFALGPVAPSVLGEPPQALLRALEDESGTNRATAVGTLAAFQRGLDSFVPSLLRHMASDEPRVQEACGQALGRIPPSALSGVVTPALIEGLQSRDRNVRIRIISLLERVPGDVTKLAPALTTVLKEPVDSDQAESEGPASAPTYSGPAHKAAEALGRLAPKTAAAGEVIAALAEVVQSGPPQRRASAARALGQFGPAAASAIPALLRLLDAPESGKEPTDYRAAAAATLSKIAPGTASAEAAVAALTAELNSPKAATRGTSLQALSRFGRVSSHATAKIRTLKESDPDPAVRKAAASALQSLDASKAGEYRRSAENQTSEDDES
jgi:HEAT repeat protein